MRYQPCRRCGTEPRESPILRARSTGNTVLCDGCGGALVTVEEALDLYRESHQTTQSPQETGSSR